MTESEHDPVESARPSLDRRDQPDAMRPGAEDTPDRKIPPEDEGPGGDAAGTPAPAAPSGADAQR